MAKVIGSDNFVSPSKMERVLSKLIFINHVRLTHVGCKEIRLIYIEVINLLGYFIFSYSFCLIVVFE